MEKPASAAKKQKSVKEAKPAADAGDKAGAGLLTAAEVREMFARLAAERPEPKTELEHANPFTLLVAVVLSAQATDVGVNKATPALFARRHAGKNAGARRGQACAS